MPQLVNVTVIELGNLCFSGEVTSRTLIFADGRKKKLRIMQPGEDQFNTTEKELKEILRGELEVLISKDQQWKAFPGARHLSFVIFHSFG